MHEQGSARILAHRGASAAHPENTVRALEVALRTREEGGEAADGARSDEGRGGVDSGQRSDNAEESFTPG